MRAKIRRYICKLWWGIALLLFTKSQDETKKVELDFFDNLQSRCKKFGIEVEINERWTLHPERSLQISL